MGRLNDKVALITGGSSGIGLAMATLFKQEGARVVVTGRDEKRLAQTEAALGEGTLAVKSDAGKLADVSQLINLIKDRFGRIDVLVINASALRLGPFEAVDEATYDAVMNENLKGPFFTIQSALPLLRPGASVIFITALSSRLGFPGSNLYAPAKAAQGCLARSLSADLVDRGIRVNAVCPGMVVTPLLTKAMGIPPEASEAAARQVVPMRRQAEPAEIAKVALFLASDDSTYVLGEEIVVDGGWSQVLPKPQAR